MRVFSHLFLFFTPFDSPNKRWRIVPSFCDNALISRHPTTARQPGTATTHLPQRRSDATSMISNRIIAESQPAVGKDAFPTVAWSLSSSLSVISLTAVFPRIRTRSLVSLSWILNPAKEHGCWDSRKKQRDQPGVSISSSHEAWIARSSDVKALWEYEFLFPFLFPTLI
ncbi:hypothetical protein P170DRAFT_246953 [Aspergillus steynii IBT 23096]|uniref:Uncharacterized protein n=1 Tax=Aspergillus steynii IBT 23096 TaxID=1392250 RepID=A0A2I2FY72_9EURO|nr:uncharacterized protein P170DRAFT_246953 [Aspergillus steynii IBT 23096]PLB45584.1 hypothetical protein P170DRAFT_246953 [Aspergillus steynii IBT 23096]